jgi:tetraacyldisaccharide 4'-kinase
MITVDKRFSEPPWKWEGFVSYLLRPLGWIYGLGMEIRNFLYDHTLLKVYKLPVAVISIGNLTVGGTGKTPLVIEIVKGLLKRNPNLRIGVLSRGYKRKQSENWVVSDGERILVAVEESGDEPYLIAGNLPGVKVFVGVNRVAAGRKAVARYSLDVLILDDAFQHRRIFRDLNILVIDGVKGFEGGRVLPAGPMREFASNVRRASCLVVPCYTGNLPGDVERYCISEVPVFGAKLTVSTIKEGISGKMASSQSITGKRVWGVCGIAHPESFLSTLQGLNVEIAGFTAFPDHHVYTPHDLSEIARRAGPDVAVVTTEKDWVKWKKAAPFREVFVISVRMNFINEADVYGFIEKFVYNEQ